MSIRALRYWEPRIDLRVFRGFPNQVIPNLRERLISFTLEDNTRLVDKAEIVFDNADGKLLDLEAVALGVIFQVSYGYVGAFAPPRLMQCRKITGGMRGGAITTNANISAGGVVNMSLRSKVWDMNIFKAVESPAQGRRQNHFGARMTIPAIVREIASQYGYAGPSALVEEMEVEPEYSEYSIPAYMSDAQWLQDQALDRDWIFSIDQDGFHFHSADFIEDADKTEELSWFSGDPDVISYEIDGDLNLPVNTSVVGPNTTTELVQKVARTAPLVGEGADLSEIGNQPVVPVMIEQTVAVRPVTTEELVSVANPTQRQVARIERSANRAMNRWALKLQLVGNPRIKARRHIRLTNFGPLLDGEWWVKKAEHTIQAGRVYLTSVEAKRRVPGRTGGRRRRSRNTQLEQKVSRSTGSEVVTVLIETST